MKKKVTVEQVLRKGYSLFQFRRFIRNNWFGMGEYRYGSGGLKHALEMGKEKNLCFCAEGAVYYAGYKLGANKRTVEAAVNRLNRETQKKEFFELRFYRMFELNDTLNLSARSAWESVRKVWRATLAQASAKRGRKAA